MKKEIFRKEGTTLGFLILVLHTVIDISRRTISRKMYKISYNIAKIFSREDFIVENKSFFYSMS